MAIKNYNVPPYYDDFDQSKNYLRVLFRPGYAVQARELTQLQTAIQAQIDRFGSHVFKEGSQVLGAEVTLDTKYSYVKLQNTVNVSGTDYIADDQKSVIVGRTLEGMTTGITATVIEMVESTVSDLSTVYVRYTSSDTTYGKYQAFGAGEVLRFSLAGGGYRYVKVGTTDSDDIPVGFGTRVSVSDGVFFAKGNFIFSPGGSIIMSKYNNRPSGRIVYTLTESVVTSAEDATLNDNALGTPNEAAPGAHRYAISLDLKVQDYDLTARNEPNELQVAVIKSGKIISQTHSEYSQLNDTLAQRTYEESGNYTVRPFQINLREYYNDGSNGGLYTTAQIRNLYSTLASDTAAEAYGRARLAVGLEPSVAYVNGYRIELVDTQYVEVEKARDEAYINASSTAARLGGYVVATVTAGVPDITNFSTADLKNSGGTIIGTARIRSLEKSGASDHRLYLFDVNMSGSYYFSQVATIVQSATNFSASVVGTATINDVGNNTLVYKLPADAIQTLRTLDGMIDTLYYVNRKYDAVLADSSGNLVINASSGEIFESSNVTDWLVAKTSDGTPVTVVSATPAVGGSSITLATSLGYGVSVSIAGPSRRNLREKIKRYIKNQNTVIASPNITPGGYDSLAVTDLFKIRGIVMSADTSTAPAFTVDGSGNYSGPDTGNVDVTDRYIVDDGQRDNFYDVARIQLRADAVPPAGQIAVVYDYFNHQPGDYFTVDSYSGISYDEIPSFHSSRGLIQLRDAVDFRPTKDTSGANFTGSGASTVNMVKPGSTITCDIQYYLPRIDKIYVDKLGNFGVAKGVSKISPLQPDDPKDSMVLYVLKLGAYTFGPQHVVPIMLDNKRYTMRDIGKLEKRVSNMEYYTALSLLERDTASQQIFDGANVRYKNGFIVDSFYGHGIGAVTNSDYRCSIDKQNGVLRPSFYQDNVKLLVDLAKSSGVRKTGDLLTLDYIQDVAIQQPYASTVEFLNPFAYHTWKGQLFMSPSTDEWRETLRKPDVIMDQSNSYTTYQVLNDNDASQTVWNDWQTMWTGSQQVDEVSKTADPVWVQGSGITDIGYWATTTTTTKNVRVDQNQMRTGVRTSYVPSVQTQSTGDRVVEMNVVPYIRSRKIYFKATGLKPNTRVYAFFDGISVADYVRPETSFLDYTTRGDNDNYLDYTSHPSGAGTLMSDATGTVIGSFVIPNTPSLKFKTGQRVFRLTSSVDNTPSNFISNAEAVYSATGMQDIVQNTVITTRNVNVVRSGVMENRVISSYKPVTSTSTETKAPAFTNLTVLNSLIGTSYNPVVTKPAENTSVTPTVLPANFEPGGTYNPVSTTATTPDTSIGCAIVTGPGQSVTTISQTDVETGNWTAPETEPPVIAVNSWPNVNDYINDTPTVTPINQSITPNDTWDKFDVTKQWLEE